MKYRSALAGCLLIATLGCAGSPDTPPFALSLPDHPDGWRRSDLERDDDLITLWRLLLPHEAKAPKAAGLRAETYKKVLKSDYDLARFYEELLALDKRNCPGAESRLLEHDASHYVYEATAPHESRCWGYQLVRLELGRDAIHALTVYSHQIPSQEAREFWLAVVTNAVFEGGR